MLANSNKNPIPVNTIQNNHNKKMSPVRPVNTIQNNHNKKMSPVRPVNTIQNNHNKKMSPEPNHIPKKMNNVDNVTKPQKPKFMPNLNITNNNKTYRQNSMSKFYKRINKSKPIEEKFNRRYDKPKSKNYRELKCNISEKNQ